LLFLPIRKTSSANSAFNYLHCLLGGHHIKSITITYLNTILVNIEVIEMDCLFVFLESFLNTVDEDE